MGNLWSLNKTKKLTITIVGDPVVGKTALILTKTKKKFPEEYQPGMNKNEAKIKMTKDRITYHITLRDTPGELEFYNLRVPSYIDTDCVLLCYSIDNAISYENIINVWIPELTKHCPNYVPIILVATKCDLFGTPDAVVPRKAGEQMKFQTPEIYQFCECSSLQMEGLKNIFDEAVKCVIEKEKKNGTTARNNKK